MSLSGIQESVLQQEQAMVSVALRSEPHHPEVPMIPEVSALEQDVTWNSWKAPARASHSTHHKAHIFVLEQSHPDCGGENLSSWCATRP